MATTKPCFTCGKENAKSCTGCKRVSYCDRKCQKSDWKEHKKICFPIGATCTRCLEIIDDSNLRRCTVPHPVHLSEDQGSSFGAGGSTWDYACEACGEQYQKSSPEADSSSAPITGGPKFCYQGPHTIKSLPDSDQRRKSDDVLVIKAGPNCQREIDNIPSNMPDVRILTIRSTGWYDDSFQPKLNVSMPKLKKIKLIDISFDQVNLNEELTPVVEELFMQNIPDECILTIQLPQLKDFSMHHYGPPDNDEWIHKMLSTATKLERFDSYKLRIGPNLYFASNDLTYVNLHRAELLHSLSVYAPKLQELSLQGCYGLDGDLTLLETHPNFSRPPGRPSTFLVNGTNACLSRSIRRTLKNNPRIIFDEDGDAANPIEGMFAGIHGNMNF